MVVVDSNQEKFYDSHTLEEWTRESIEEFLKDVENTSLITDRDVDNYIKYERLLTEEEFNRKISEELDLD